MQRFMWRFIVPAMLVGVTSVLAENIDPFDTSAQYTYCENAGWLNFEPDDAEPNVGATVTSGGLSGFVWAENIGWINLDPNFGGVSNDWTGLLSGFAWGENVGWINFAPNVVYDANHYGVTIDGDGNLDGWAWGENIGWIHFQSLSPVSYKVQTSWVTDCVVDAGDLVAVADMWILSEEDLDADLDASGTVDFVDYSSLAQVWLNRCPLAGP